MDKFIKIAERDNVAVALEPLKAGESVLGVTLLEDVPSGHKFALTPIAEGSDVIDWINMFIKKPFEGVDEALAETIKRDTREALKDKLVSDDGYWHIDYVRLRMRAVRLD